MPVVDVAEYLKYRYHTRRQAALLYLGGRCEKCGTGILAIPGDGLHFDHVDPLNKSFQIGSSRASTVSESRFWEEVEKCQLLCKPCHLEKSRLDGSWIGRVTHGKMNAWQKLKCECDLCIKAKEDYRISQNSKRRERRVNRTPLA